MGRRERTEHFKKQSALPANWPYRQIIWFQGFWLLRRKENSSQDPRRRLRFQLRYRLNIHCLVQEC